jgi:hypothetical protein
MLRQGKKSEIVSNSAIKEQGKRKPFSFLMGLKRIPLFS